MQSSEEQRFRDDIRGLLIAIGLELETAASSARHAAEAFPDREQVWPHLQQLLARLAEANRQSAHLQQTVDEAITRAQSE